MVIPKLKIKPLLKDNFLHYYYGDSLYFKKRIKLLKDSDNLLYSSGKKLKKLLWNYCVFNKAFKSSSSTDFNATVEIL